MCSHYILEIDIVYNEIDPSGQQIRWASQVFEKKDLRFKIWQTFWQAKENLQIFST